MRELAKILHKKEPHLIYINYAGIEPSTFKYETEEVHEGIKQTIIYSGEFVSRRIKERR